MDHPAHELQPPFWKSPSGFTLVVAMVVGGFYLVAEHRAHLLGSLPYLVLLACPLMHLFMHKGDGHGGQKRHRHDPQHPKPGVDEP